jgi:NAD(P)-dependent dehydrogenase (short-subunit alcohol dehydrogenase family)
VELEDAVAIVTGGGSGIGRATALLLAGRKAHVVVASRSSGALEETVALIKSRGGHGIAVPTDVRNAVSVQRLVEAVLAGFGRIDVLVNGAGIALAKPVKDLTEEEWDEVVETNLKGVFLCSRAVLPSMITAGQGVIINVSSVLGRVGIGNYGAYCASKFGVIGLTEAMAAECQATGIRNYAVCPGPTFTALHRRLVGEINAQRSMPPERVAERIVGLVTHHAPEGSSVTVVVDEQAPATSSDATSRSWQQRVKRWIMATIRLVQGATKRR